MKCPYCGHESETNPCGKCKAWIPEQPKEETKEETVKVSRKRNKE